MQSNFREGIERVILNTFLFSNLSTDNEFELILEHKLDFSLFLSNITIKSVAKAITNLQEQDYPIDDKIVYEYIEKRMPLDWNEWFEITTTTPVRYKTLKHYIKMLTDENIRQYKNSLMGRI